MLKMKTKTKLTRKRHSLNYLFWLGNKNSSFITVNYRVEET